MCADIANVTTAPFSASLQNDFHSIEKPQGPTTPSSPLHPFPEELEKQATELLDDISKKIGPKSLSRRLAALYARLSEVAENHFLIKQQKEYQDKQRTSGNVQDQQIWKERQAYTHIASGGGMLLLNALAIIGPAGFNDICKQLAQSGLTNSLEGLFSKLCDSQLTPLSHDQQLYFGNLQSERQSVEGIKSALRELLQLALEAQREEKQSFASIARA